MNDTLLADSASHLFTDCCTPQQVRFIEAGGSADAMWKTILDAGFADALSPESAGGAGMSLSEALPLLLACGRFALPLPLAQTMVVRAFLAEAGKVAPDGPITITRADPVVAGIGITCSATPYGRVAHWALVERATEVLLLPIDSAHRTHSGGYGSLDADLHWADLPSDAIRLPASVDWRAVGACLYAAQMAGAMERLFAMTVTFANDRVQFGRPIAKFQAIQQQVSILAEQVTAAGMAAQFGTDSPHWIPVRLAAAVAKSRTSEAVASVTAIAHAVHGAMGIAAEFDLQLYTRRLHEWRRCCGTESWWNREIGTALVKDGSKSTLAFMNEQLFSKGTP
jgi:acyl-CoA dehydrogenase